MNTIMFLIEYVFVCLSTIVSSELYASYEPQVFMSPFKFGYKSDDILEIYIHLKNRGPYVTATAYATLYQQGVEGEKETLNKSKIEDYFKIHHQLNSLKISIALELHTQSNLCETQIILEGQDVNSITNDTIDAAAFKYDDSCLKDGKPCIIEVDLENGCNADTTKYTIIIIISSIFVMASILLVSFAIWKRCWIKRNPSRTPELQTNENYYIPFSRLFRRERELEIQNTQEHYYEVIDLSELETDGDTEQERSTQ